jgi:hypothetical protein
MKKNARVSRLALMGVVVMMLAAAMAAEGSPRKITDESRPLGALSRARAVAGDVYVALSSRVARANIMIRFWDPDGLALPFLRARTGA